MEPAVTAGEEGARAIVSQFSTRWFPLLCHTESHFVAPLASANLAELEAQFGIPPSLDRAVTKRRREYLVGRLCAASALRHAGHTGDCSVPPQPDRAPRWPAGYVGSITHTDTWAAAAVAPKSVLRGLGIDSERRLARERAAGVERLILTPAERSLLAGGSLPGLAWEDGVTLVFSAKESLYKCLYPLVGVYIDHQDVELASAPAWDGTPGGLGRFGLRLLRDLGAGFGAGRILHGTFGLSVDHLHSAVELAAPRP